MKILDSIINGLISILNWLILKLKKDEEPKTESYKEEKISPLPYTKPNELNIPFENLDIPLLKTYSLIKEYRPTILLMDDFPGMVSILRDDFDFIDKNIKNEINIISADSLMAAFAVDNFLKMDNKKFEYVQKEDDYIHPTIDGKILKIDMALLDITISGIMNINDDLIELDGIDVAKLIREKYPECKIYFVTGHAPNKRNPKIFKYMDKFEKIFNEDITPYIIPKNSSHISHYINSLIAIFKEYQLDFSKLEKAKINKS
jgi:hypothetical protein